MDLFQTALVAVMVGSLLAIVFFDYREIEALRARLGKLHACVAPDADKAASSDPDLDWTWEALAVSHRQDSETLEEAFEEMDRRARSLEAFARQEIPQAADRLAAEMRRLGFPSHAT